MEFSLPRTLIEIRTIFVLDGTQIVKAFAQGSKKYIIWEMLKNARSEKSAQLMLVEFKVYHVNFYKHTAKPIDSNQ